MTRWTMDKCREEFERSKTFKYFYSTLMHFDEELNCYSSNHSLRIRDAELLTAAWWAFQEQQLKVEGLKGQLIKLGFSDNGGQLMKPPLGIQPSFLSDRQKELSKLLEKFINGVGIENAGERLKIAKESGLDMWTYGWGFTTKQLEQALKDLKK